MSEQTEQAKQVFDKMDSILEILDRIATKCDQMLAILDAHKDHYHDYVRVNPMTGKVEFADDVSGHEGDDSQAQ